MLVKDKRLKFSRENCNNLIHRKELTQFMCLLIFLNLG